MKVSVMMPIYNSREDYLREAIESILNQTYSDFEFLIINDSPENTKLDDIVNSYNDPRIKYSKNSKNLGVIATRNVQLKMSKGEYLAFLDHDDIATPNRLELQVQYLDSHIDVGVCGSCATRIPSGKSYSVPVDDEDIKLALFQKCPIVFPSVMIRKSVMTDNSIEFSDDYDYGLWCRMASFTKFHNLPMKLVEYRVHGDNMSLTTDFDPEPILRSKEEFRKKNPSLARSFEKRSADVVRTKLFGVYLFKTVKSSKEEVVYLFGVLPVLKKIFKREIV